MMPRHFSFAFPPEVHRVKYDSSDGDATTSFAFPPEVHRVKFGMPEVSLSGRYVLPSPRKCIG